MWNSTQMRFSSYAYRVGRAQYQHENFVNVLHGGRHCGNIGEVESRQPVLGARAHLFLSLSRSLVCTLSRCCQSNFERCCPCKTSAAMLNKCAISSTGGANETHYDVYFESNISYVLLHLNFQEGD
jgi:hypothetical protein